MKSLITYIKQHVNSTRQDSLLLVATIYGKSARSLWRALGYDSVCEFDVALSKARMTKCNRKNKVKNKKQNIYV